MESVTRRGALGLTALGAASYKRILGANNRVQVGFIGFGLIGGQHVHDFKNQTDVDLAAMCDVYQPRLEQGIAACGQTAKPYTDFRKMLENKDLQAIVVCTPDHWHALMTMMACAAGKDVYVEKPMCHTNEEIKQLVNTVKETKRVLQVGSQTTSGDQWWKARKAIADGMIGQMIMSQGSYHRNSTEGEWNWPIEAEASGRVSN